jgi:hypothetical protein
LAAVIIDWFFQSLIPPGYVSHLHSHFHHVPIPENVNMFIKQLTASKLQCNYWF